MGKIKLWQPSMSDKETAELAYWERNVLALYFAEGWYNDDGEDGNARYKGWRRVLSLRGGRITFHIPDDFDVGRLAKIEKNWDGHSTLEKWRYILARCGIPSFDVDLVEGSIG
jgi:hypothetical protein